VTRFDQIRHRAGESGLAVRGAFHPAAGEFDAWFSGPVTVVLLGFIGGQQWQSFAHAPEARDGLPHPLDRWSRRVIGLLAREFGARDVYPSETPGTPLPFQRLALRCEPVHQSPVGLLIHPRFGLWHAYRGALLLPAAIDLPSAAPGDHPCESCETQPCLSACPVGAFRPDHFELDACVEHVSSEAGRECRERGCLARRACPIGAEFRYGDDQARFHMRAFLQR
jgi:ferredoxin